MKVATLIKICLGLAFFQGVASYIGIPSLGYQLLIDLVVYLLFAYALIKFSSTFSTPVIGLFTTLTVLFLVSGLVNSSDFFTSYRMYRNTLIPFLFFLAIVNLPIKERDFQKVNMFLFFMLFAQIVVSVLKYLAWGVREDGIVGTFSTSAGQMSTIFPLLAILFLMFLYLIYNRNNIYLFLMAGFLFMAWGGGKRAMVFILPVMVLIAYLLYKKMEFNVTIFSPANALRAILLIILLSPILYLVVIFTPTLNPERQFGGTFDIQHILDYSTNYHAGDHEVYRPNRYGEQSVLYGRVATTVSAIEFTTNHPKAFFTGFGPSSIYATSRGDEDLLRFGVVSFQTGFAQYVISTGIPAALLLVLLYVIISYRCLKHYQYFPSYWRALILGVFLCVLVLLFDFFNYSSAFVHGFIPSMVYFYLAGAIINKQKTIKEQYNLK